MATVHAYPLKRCTASTHVTIAQLMSNASSDGLAKRLAPLAASAHRHHVPLRVDEINAISCGGVRGVSDTYAAALWSLDAMFALARAGVDGVNVHTPPRSINQMITFRDDDGAWSAHVAPVYYGLLMFAEATPPGSRLVRVSGTAAPGLSTWATLGRDGTVRVVLINKSVRFRRHAQLRAPARASAGIVQLLRAPGLAAKTGVTLGGQSFGAATTTGMLSGGSTATAIRASATGVLGRCAAGQRGPVDDSALRLNRNYQGFSGRAECFTVLAHGADWAWLAASEAVLVGRSG